MYVHCKCLLKDKLTNSIYVNKLCLHLQHKQYNYVLMDVSGIPDLVIIPLIE